MKVCMTCKNEKNESEFHKETCRIDGLCRRCRQCESDRKKRFAERGGYRTKENREKGREKAKKWREKNPEKASFFCSRYAKNNRERLNEINKKWTKENPEKKKAQLIIRGVLRNGKMIRPNICSKCEIECKPEAHHSDYSKPLDVDWVCKKCHEGVHHRCL